MDTANEVQYSLTLQILADACATTPDELRIDTPRATATLPLASPITLSLVPSSHQLTRKFSPPLTTSTILHDDLKFDPLRLASMITATSPPCSLNIFGLPEPLQRLARCSTRPETRTASAIGEKVSTYSRCTNASHMSHGMNSSSRLL